MKVKIGRPETIRMMKKPCWTQYRYECRVRGSILPVKAVILAADQGARMRKFTNELPKPILEHIVAGILAAGNREIFIVTGWRAEVVENHFDDGSKWNARIAFGRLIFQDVRQN